MLASKKICFGNGTIKKIIFVNFDHIQGTSSVIAPISCCILSFNWWKGLVHEHRVSICHIFIMYSFTDIGHAHKHIRKALLGKSAMACSVVLCHLVFTFIFSLYSYYFLSHFQSIIPSIVLHSYCNILGTPIITNSNYRDM
jgi:hypothetical protein